MAYLTYPDIDPVLLSIGPIAIRWYGLAYLVGLGAGLLLLRRDAHKRDVAITADESLEGMLWLAVGLFLGARLGFALFYNPAYFLANPLQVFAIWTGGMSFHGGLIGATLGGWLWTVRRAKPFYPLADIMAAAAPIGLGLGRLANFINGELSGRASVLPWAMVFPGAGDVARHPSQIYEALLEGLVLFIILRILLTMRLPDGTVFWSFVSLYGLFRFLVEFTRQPDSQIGLIGDLFSMGQLLSLPMAVGGAYMVFRVLTRHRREAA